MNNLHYSTCPCCGYVTNCSEYDSCPVCDWERNIYQETNPEISGGANAISLRAAQRNFQQIGSYDVGAMFDDPLDVRMAAYVKDPDWRPLPPVENPHK